MQAAFAAQLKDRIDRQYSAGRYSLGWRLLYSPDAVLRGARVAFVGLNPGGSELPLGHPEAEFAMDYGSAYAVESWDGALPGKSKLQRQVLALFEKIGERPEAVLTGNLVPFRSPSWDLLSERHRALAFGKAIWRDIIAEVRPELMIGMGGEAFTALRDILGVHTTERISVDWGNVCGERGNFVSGILIGIPHLSRFQIITRIESQVGLRKLLFNQLRTESSPA